MLFLVYRKFSLKFREANSFIKKFMEMKLQLTYSKKKNFFLILSAYLFLKRALNHQKKRTKAFGELRPLGTLD